MTVTAFALIFIVWIIAALFLAWIATRGAQRATAAADAADALVVKLLQEQRQLQRVRDDITAMGSRIDKLAGRVYSQTRKPSLHDGFRSAPDAADDVIDDELAAELALQNAPPASPSAATRK